MQPASRAAAPGGCTVSRQVLADHVDEELLASLSAGWSPGTVVSIDGTAWELDGDDAMIARKVRGADAAGLTPMLCVGEPDGGTTADAADFVFVSPDLFWAALRTIQRISAGSWTRHSP